MAEKINIFLNFIIVLKNYFSRTASYLSPISFLLILLNFKKTYNINIKSIWFVIISIILILVVGKIDYKFILNKELKYNNKKNDIKHQLDRIEKIIENGCKNKSRKNIT